MESGDQRAIGIDGGFGSMMFDATAPVGTEEIEAEGIRLGFVEIEQPGFHFDPSGWVDFTFEDAVLDALAVVETGFGDAIEAAFAGIGGGGDVVGNEDQHGLG